MAKTKLFKIFGYVILCIGLALICTGAFLRACVGKFKYISAEEKNAYVTNIDLSSTVPSVYISYDYEPDRYIVTRLSDSEYSESMQEGDRDRYQRHVSVQSAFPDPLYRTGKC